MFNVSDSSYDICRQILAIWIFRYISIEISQTANKLRLDGKLRLLDRTLCTYSIYIQNYIQPKLILNRKSHCNKEIVQNVLYASVCVLCKIMNKRRKVIYVP